MAKKSSRKPDLAAPSGVPSPESTPSQRVAWLLDVMWGGNRSEMARAVGCSHSVLTKIAAGQQAPGRRLLAAVASHPKVNPAWLLAGEGEPLLAERQDTPAEGWPIPIAKQPLPGPPDQYRSLLAGENFPVAGAFYRSSRYWLEVQRSEPIVRSSLQRVEDGDLLLMETDKSWRKQVTLVDDHVCVVQISSDKGEDHKLGLVSYYSGDSEEPPHLSADFFERWVDESKLVERIVLDKYPGGKIEVRRDLVQQSGEKADGGGLRRVSQLELGKKTQLISIDDIVAVCVLMVRRC